jgi:hypothetical protein
LGLFGATSDDPDGVGQLEPTHHFVEKRDPPLQRLDEVHLEVGAPDSHHDTGQTGAASHVDDARAGWQQVGDDGTVEQVALPQPGHLAGADQTARQGVGGEQICEAASEIQSVSEN